MNKKILIASTIFLTSGVAIAKSVNLDTNITWNSSVVEQALNNAGLLGTNNALNDVRVTHERILSVLLKKKTFSPRFATQTCLEQCNRSDFLKEGRGRSGRKCPEICTDFTNELITVNNQFTRDGTIPVGDTGLMVKQKDGLIRRYAEDRKFYILTSEADPVQRNEYQNIKPHVKKYISLCNFKYEPGIIFGVIFDSNKNQAIGLFGAFYGDNYEQTYCVIKGYEDYDFGFTAYDDIFFYRTGKLQEDKEKLLEPYKEYEAAAKETRKILRDIYSLQITGAETNAYLYDNNISEYSKTIKKYEDALNAWEKLYLSEEKYLEDPSILKRFSEDTNNSLLKTHNVNLKDNVYSSLKGARKCINDLKRNNGKTVNWSHMDTDTETEAYESAKTNITAYCEGTINRDKIRCSGDCNKLPFTDDIVTCTIGDVTVKYIFDDICD